MKITLGFSPCPNDTFIFDALVNNKIDTEGLEFEPVLEDVETLNEWAMQGKLAITKLSFPAFFQSMDKYVLLNAGSALGKGVGPLLVTANAQYSGNNTGLPDGLVQQAGIALPGLNTTANLLFSFAFPEAKNKTFIRFDLIEDYVLSETKTHSAEGGEKLGVIIHENRFTYEQKGLYKVADLGAIWEERTGVPVPLGGIAVNQSVKRSLAVKIDHLIKKSLLFAFSNYPVLPDYVKLHSQTMSEDVMRKHIELYVNNYSLDLSDDGKEAIEKLYRVFLQINNRENDREDLLFL
jgi:1,4-dihydroxy-6-naphthoate synthase